MDDIPRSVILVLLVITVLISVLGTWTVMDQLSSAKVPVQVQKPGDNSGSAYASLTLMDPNAPKATESGAGYASITYQPPKEEGN
jgi:hypothetical protein